MDPSMGPMSNSGVAFSSYFIARNEWSCRHKGEDKMEQTQSDTICFLLARQSAKTIAGSRLAYAKKLGREDPLGIFLQQTIQKEWQRHVCMNIDQHHQKG